MKSATVTESQESERNWIKITFSTYINTNINICNDFYRFSFFAVLSQKLENWAFLWLLFLLLLRLYIGTVSYAVASAPAEHRSQHIFKLRQIEKYIVCTHTYIAELPCVSLCIFSVCGLVGLNPFESHHIVLEKVKIFPKNSFSMKKKTNAPYIHTLFHFALFLSVCDNIMFTTTTKTTTTMKMKTN